MVGVVRQHFGLLVGYPDAPRQGVLTVRLLGLLLLCPALAWGADRFATPSGLTSGSCLTAATACTIDRARGLAMVGGDSLYLLAGTYSEGINTSQAGSAGNPIVYQPYVAGSEVILDGLAQGQTDRTILCDANYSSFRNLTIIVRDSGLTNTYGVRFEQANTGCELKNSIVKYEGADVGALDFVYMIQARGTAFNVERNSVIGGMIGISVNTDSGVPTGEVLDNTIADVANGIAEHADCISVGSTNQDAAYGLVIRRNRCYGYRDDGIDLLGISNAIVEDNIIGDPTDDTQTANSCIKAGNATGVGTIIRRNKCVHLVAHTPRQYGIVTNGLSNGFIYSNILSVNSTAIEIAEFGGGGGGGDGNTVANNVAIGGIHASSYGVFVNSAVSSATVYNNYMDGQTVDLYVTTGSVVTGGHNHLRNNTSTLSGTYTGTDQTGDPLLTANWEPQLGSPLIGAGVRWWAPSAPAQGFDGLRFKNPPSIGAFESSTGTLRPTEMGSDVLKARGM